MQELSLVIDLLCKIVEKKLFGFCQSSAEKPDMLGPGVLTPPQQIVVTASFRKIFTCIDFLLSQE